MIHMVIEGVVVQGRQLGRKLGFPTANLPVPEGFTADDGVYEAWAEVDGVRYKAMSNLGRNPSVGGMVRRLETHLFDFEGRLYDRILRVELGRKIRDEQTFATLEELQAQIAADRDKILKL
ncbi:MAG: riboflavin kinase [Alistipes sp.]